MSLDPQDDSDTISLVKEWIGRKQKKGGAGLNISDSVLSEALFLAKQFLNDLETPGNLFQFIKIAERQLLIEGRTDEQISPDDLYTALSQLTGLPRSILDDKGQIVKEKSAYAFAGNGHSVYQSVCKLSKGGCTSSYPGNPAALEYPSANI